MIRNDALPLRDPGEARCGRDGDRLPGARYEARPRRRHQGLARGLSHDAERLSRFEREARLLASLNHPHVATLHGFEEASGTRFLVMELVEGETLADRIARHPLPIEEALPSSVKCGGSRSRARQGHHPPRPEALEREGNARRQGQSARLRSGESVHRLAPERAAIESPTVTRSPSESGVILGTAAYMSPEQARGKAPRQADGHLGVRMLLVRSVDRAGGVSGRDRLRHHCAHPREGARVGSASRPDAWEESGTCSLRVSRRIR